MLGSYIEPRPSWKTTEPHGHSRQLEPCTLRRVMGASLDVCSTSISQVTVVACPPTVLTSALPKGPVSSRAPSSLTSLLVSVSIPPGEAQLHQ